MRGRGSANSGWAALALRGSYAPSDLVETIFGVQLPNTLPHDAGSGDTLTLIQALNARGGGINALLRHAVAALLNSAHPDVDFALSTSGVISMFQTAITTGNYEAAKNLFAAENEQGCPISGK